MTRAASTIAMTGCSTSGGRAMMSAVRSDASGCVNGSQSGGNATLKIAFLWYNLVGCVAVVVIALLFQTLAPRTAPLPESTP